MGRFTGKIAVITGASKGIGAGIAKRLASEGASVVVNYASSAGRCAPGRGGYRAGRRQGRRHRGQRLQRRPIWPGCSKRFARRSAALMCSSTMPASMIRSRSRAFLVSEFNRHFDTNVLGLLLVTKAALPLFPATGGSIVNISSVVSTLAPLTPRSMSARRARSTRSPIPSEGVRAAEDQGQRRQARLRHHRGDAFRRHGRRRVRGLRRGQHAARPPRPARRHRGLGCFPCL